MKKGATHRASSDLFSGYKLLENWQKIAKIGRLSPWLN